MPLVILNEDNMKDTVENLQRQIDEFGDDINNENYVGLVIDGKVGPILRTDGWVSFSIQLY